MTQNKENIRLLISVGLAGIFIAAILWAIGKIISPQPRDSDNTVNMPVLSRVSLGDKILVTAHTNPDKQAGVQAFASGDYTTAASKFQASLQTNRNDPETLIYFNNAKIGKSRALKVAVSVPISGLLNVSEEILRGVAQAQDEVNKSGGINGVPLLLEITDDGNDLAIAKQLAPELAKDSSILAVMGHNRPDISAATGEIYNRRGLVMMSPATQNSGIGKYVFSVSPSSSVFGDTLARYMTQNARRKNIAICADSTTPIGKLTIDIYTRSIRQAGGNITSTDCNFGAKDFQPSAILSRAISDGAEGLLLLPRLDNIQPAIDMARENKGRLALFSYAGMYTYDTLNRGQENFKGMVLPVLWHPDAVPDNAFTKDAAKLWGGRVSPRTAIAYDALEAIIAGLKQGNTREELQKALYNPNFSATGATGTIQFSPSGDRKVTPFLVKIDTGYTSGTGYDFVLLQ